MKIKMELKTFMELNSHFDQFLFEFFTHHQRFNFQ